MAMTESVIFFKNPQDKDVLLLLLQNKNHDVIELPLM